MPLLAKKIFSCSKPPTDIKQDETIYVIPHTREQFRSKEEYEKRLHLYRSRIWTCRSTGHVNLTHEEAWNSEKAVLKTLKEQFSPCYDKPVLQQVHHSTKSLDCLVDETWLLLQQVLVVGERVMLKVKSGGKSMKAVVVKVDTAGVESNPTSNCSSPSSDKENAEKDDNVSSPKKWVPPKLLPYKYSIRFEGEDSVIHSVPVSDLGRGDKPPSKELLRLFIRTYAIRAGQTPTSPWIVDDNQVRKLDLQSKFANFLLSPVRWKSDEINRRLNDEITKKVSPAKGSPRVKTKMEAKEEKKKEKVKNTLNKLKAKSEKAEKKAKTLEAKKERKKARRMEAYTKKLEERVEVIEVDSSDNSSDEGGSDVDSDDSDMPLIAMKSQVTPQKTQLTPKKSSLTAEKLSVKSVTPKKKASVEKGKKEKNSDASKTKQKKELTLAQLKKKLKNQGEEVSLADLKKDVNELKRRMKARGKDLSLADLKKKLSAKKLLDKSKKNAKDKKKAGQDPRQLTLFDLSKKKGMKTPEKKSSANGQKTPLKEQKTPELKKKISSPPRTPAIVIKLKQALKKDDKVMVGVLVTQAAKVLNFEQRARLPPEIKERVIKKYEIIQEKLKIAKMSESEKKEYLAKQAADKKEKLRQQMKERLKQQRKRYEDTSLELKPLPAPKLVVTPEGLPNECFGDIAMVTEFIANYSGLLMPDDEYPIYTDALMKAVTTGKDGFVYLSRILTILLQTLLQDQIAEDYQDLKVPLTDIPVTQCTTSELVRLCLRKQDADDDAQSDNSDESKLEDQEDEVPDELLQMMDTQEFYQLDAVQKIQILKGLCLRIMGTYSVQDYMEEKQQECSRLWREKIAQYKEDKEKRLTQKAEVEKLKNETDQPAKKEGKDKQKPEEKTNTLLLTHFYGKKNLEDGQSSGNNSETPIDVDENDADLATVVKRRRVTTAQAQEERKQKEKEEKMRREKEMELLKHQKEREIFEKQFAEGIYLAKITQRQAPIGTDRNHSRYWVFSDVTPGLFVEKGWISDVIDYSVKPADAVDSDHSSSSSDDDSGGEEAEGAPTNKKNKVAKVKKCVDTTFPRVSQNLWFTYDSMKDVDNLIESLHERGSRESVLKTELKKRYSDISSAIYKFKRSNKELRDCDGDKEMFEAFKKELLETEMRLRHGGLGGVMDFSSWEARLQTAPNIGPLAECLLEVQEHVLDKFRDGIFAQKPKKKPEVKEEDKESDDEDDEPLMAPGIISWRDAVKTCATYSRLHVLLGILDSCIKWEKSSENAKCKICRKKGEEDRMLLCDDCNQAFHMFCLRPALLDVPTGDWHCPACAPQYRKRVQNIPGRYKEYSQNDSDTEDFGKSSRRKEKTIVHEENCVECGGDEDLISCAECPSVYHLECHDPPLRHPPRGRWVCNDCKNGITRKTRRGSQRAARKVNRAAAKRKRKEESEDEEESDDESPKRERKPRKGKVKKKTESSDEEDEDSDEEDESEDEFEPPPKKAARTSKQQTVAKRGRKSKDSSSPKVGRPKGKRATQSPEVAYDTKPKASRRAPSDLSIAESIIDQMMKYKDAWPFYDLVLKKDVPDYYEIIKQPISFQKIKDRLNCLVYGSPQEVINAVALLFRNAAQYNKVDSDIWQLMEISEKHFIDLLGKHLPMYVYSRDQVNGDDDPMDTSDGRKSRRSK